MTLTLRPLTLALALASLVLSGCSIEQEDQQEAKVAVDRITGEQLLAQATNDYERFLANCRICIEGNLTDPQIDELVATYLSSYTGRLDWGPDAFIYQRMEPTNAFEKCAQKAIIMGNRKPFENMIVRQGRIARTARFFYANNEPAEGAFWLRRLVNVKGERDGLEVAGRVFIQDLRTIPAGVRLLEQSARMGNHNARQMLLGLMNPGSSYYQEITANTYVDDDENNQEESAPKADKKAEKKAGKQAQQNTAAQEDQNAATLKRLSGKESVPSNPQMRNRQAHQARLTEMEARTEQMRQAALDRIKKLEAEK